MQWTSVVFAFVWNKHTHHFLNYPVNIRFMRTRNNTCPVCREIVNHSLIGFSIKENPIPFNYNQPLPATDYWANSNISFRRYK